MLRIDLEQSLSESDLDLKNLSPFQRILLTTDGTVTEILEAQFWEKINLIKLFQQQTICDVDVPYLDIKSGTEILTRKILLQGDDTKTNYIYAESILVPEKLDQNLQQGLINTDKPLGRLMIEAKTETYREILSCKQEKSDELNEHFDQNPDSDLVSRTYRVFANQKPIILITEKFLKNSF
ncbi:MAG: chorismate pyruvate-lyase family protein [Gammaproteobacteria bacterium]